MVMPGLSRVRLIMVLAAVVATSCGPSATVKIVDVGPAPDPLGTGALFGAAGVQATYEVTGPTHHQAVVCKFSGQHNSNGGQSRAGGWVIYTQIVDLNAGETTRGSCTAISFPPLGDEAPSQPVVSLSDAGSLPTAPDGWGISYVPATPWP